MSQPKYLSGDKASIEEFLSKFDVGTLAPLQAEHADRMR